MKTIIAKTIHKITTHDVDKMLSRHIVTAVLSLSPFLFINSAWSANCQDLSNLTLSDAEVTQAEVITEGNFSEPTNNGSTKNNQAYQHLPEFCRVALTLTPSSDSDIKMELWIPTQTWNGKYMGVGNGAFTGNIRYKALIDPLSRGYAVSSTDTGHIGNTASFALGHPEKLIDFGWRAVHEMAIVSKQVVAALKDQRPNYAYWSGCSAGGRQAMVEAQKFPTDFDGIIAGAPGLDWTGRAAASLRVASHLNKNPTARLTQQQRELVHEAAIEACDSDDGLRDSLISKPMQCEFDPGVLQCSGQNADSNACLSSQQVDTVRLLYSSPANPATGRAITGLLPGSELGWTDLGWTASARATGLEQYRYLVYADPNWTIDQFDFDRDISKAESMDNNTLNALDTNLTPFFQAGGKLIQYHGWSDPQISPSNVTQYYDRVSDLLGGRDAIHDSYRLFMAPGMGHCAGGYGPNSFDMISALEAWVEDGVAPSNIEAVHRTNGAINRSRPLVPYPEIATYDEIGSIDKAESFSCR